eukprot:TRINITY_DN5915_c0_g1_i1.p1 TRINITY_DN5915_c0_g1~~TRINITY_DN5915_c0_g1_i1.p1  ORF type:complete len:102 (+),score=24.88 TRINITY_DN5915_c0_g1_i1:78-383(+)
MDSQTFVSAKNSPPRIIGETPTPAEKRQHSSHADERAENRTANQRETEVVIYYVHMSTYMCGQKERGWINQFPSLNEKKGGKVKHKHHATIESLPHLANGD